MQKQRKLIKRIVIEYSVEELDNGSSPLVRKVTTEERYLNGEPDPRQTMYKSEFLG
jgi:hypothetical protein